MCVRYTEYELHDRNRVDICCNADHVCGDTGEKEGVFHVNRIV